MTGILENVYFGAPPSFHVMVKPGGAL